MTNFTKDVLTLIVVITLTLISCTHGQTVGKDLMIIDSFPGMNSIVMELQQTFPIAQFSSYSSSKGVHDPNLIGGTRDIELVVEAGIEGEVVSLTVTSAENEIGHLVAEAALHTSINFYLQYDASGSENLNVTGLTAVHEDGIDVTLGGDANSFHLRLQTDKDIDSEFVLYDVEGGICKQEVKLHAQQAMADIYFLYQNLTGNCDMQHIGAIQVYFFLYDETTAIVSLLAISQFNHTNAPSHLLIDNFVEGDFLLLLTLNETLPPGEMSLSKQFVSKNGPKDPNLIGGGRDLELIVTRGVPGLVFVVAIDGDSEQHALDASSPTGGNATTLIQYDGQDGSMNLNVTGLTDVNVNGVDLTLGGHLNAFHLHLGTNFPMDASFNVYDITGGVSTSTYHVDSRFFDQFIEFSTFNGNADFTRVGAIEVFLHVDAKIEVDLQVIEVVNYSGSALPPQPPTTPSPLPSVSNATFRNKHLF